MTVPRCLTAPSCRSPGFALWRFGHRDGRVFFRANPFQTKKPGVQNYA